MSFLVSPGVQVKEIDLTNVVPAVATSIGAIASAFEKGPVSEVTAISSEEELVKVLVNQRVTVISLKIGFPQQIFCNTLILSELFV